MGVPGETLAAIVSCREAGVVPLREQLRQRVDMLGPGLDFGEADARTALAEVFEAYEPPGFSLSAMSERCAIEREDGGSIVIGGKLLVGGREVGLLPAAGPPEAAPTAGSARPTAEPASAETGTAAPASLAARAVRSGTFGLALSLVSFGMHSVLPRVCSDYLITR